ncbi:phage tail tape measure protein [Methylomonas sp. LW13]|uniref:phage tail tape measure protein n=1 Tax=unclassified Methylomonas TaxID=2608980 RepID=UPI00068C9427|nr:phage tail tape measure protein [Methylomonas sp. LW13]QBC27141.1 phage tail tape measure protein [Methylomonas sp. LW13]
MNGMQNLTFMVSLLDRVSGPTAKIMSSIDSMTTKFQNGTNKIAYGAAGLWGVGTALQANTQKAIEFESKMADVAKMVDFPSPAGVKNFGNELLKMSRVIPITANGLAEIAAAGGEQGIQLPDLPPFIDTVAKMSTAFDMGTSAAGESIGKLANIFNIPISNISNLGDQINHLSNNTNAKASDMVNLLGRTGGIAKQIGLTTAQTAALSAAMLSLGQPVDVAGTSINAFLQKLYTARNQGDGFNDALATIGLSAKKLESNFQSGPQQAIDDFLQRISGLSKHSQALVLGDLFGQEYSDNITLLVGNLGVYQKTLGLVSDATKYQGSMQNEFNIKALTTANRLQLLSNHWDNVLISAGTIFLPKIVEWVGKLNNNLAHVADKITRWSTLFPELTGLVSTLAGGIVGIIAGLAGLSILSGVGTLLGAGFALATAPAVATAVAIGSIGWAVYKLLDTWSQWTYGLGIFDTIAAGYQAAIRDTTAFIEKTASAIDFVMTGFEGLKNWFKNFNLWEFLLSGVDALIGKINMIPGIDIDLGGMPKPIAAPVGLNSGGGKGGLMNKFSTLNDNKNQSRSIGTVQINNYESKRSLSQLVDDVMMAGG